MTFEIKQLLQMQLKEKFFPEQFSVLPFELEKIFFIYLIAIYQVDSLKFDFGIRSSI